MTQVTNDNTRNSVRDHYGKITESKTENACCNQYGSDAKATSMGLGYSDSDVNQVPDGANMGLGCGNPKAIASLKLG